MRTYLILLCFILICFVSHQIVSASRIDEHEIAAYNSEIDASYEALVNSEENKSNQRGRNRNETQRDRNNGSESRENRSGRANRSESGGRSERNSTDRENRNRSDRGDRNRSDRGDRNRSDRGDRNNSNRGDRNRSDRGDRNNSNRGDRNNRSERGDRNNSRERGDRNRSDRGDRNNSNRGDRNNSGRGDRNNSGRGDRNNSGRGDRNQTERGDRNRGGANRNKKVSVFEQRFKTSNVLHTQRAEASRGRDQWGGVNQNCTNFCVKQDNKVCEVRATNGQVVRSYCCHKFGCEPLSEYPDIKVNAGRNRQIDFNNSFVCPESEAASDEVERQTYGDFFYNRRRIHC